MKYARWRAAALVAVYVLFGVHIAHWKLNGSTLAPLELNEVMYTLEAGIVTAGFLLMATLVVATALVGRFFCSWACHILALEDLCAWLLGKLRIRPRPVRSRLLLVVPPAALVYMFVWPQISRILEGLPLPRLRILGDEEGWASFVTTDFWRNLPGPWIAGLTFLVCGFAMVYFLGSRSFCMHACPYGALFAVADRLAPGRIKLTGHCEQCGICTAVCSSQVRVHEEIARFGKVVDANCLKDLDCVSACPQEALSFGFTAPAGRASFSRTGRRRLPFDFTRTEELSIAATFLAVLVVFRGLYAAIPFLTALGLAGIVSYLAVLALRLGTRPDVRLVPFRLKRTGTWTRGGYAFAAAMTAFGLLTVHSAFIRAHEALGQRAFDAVRAAVDRGQAPLPGDALRSAIRHLGLAREWGLLRPLVRDHQLAALHLKSADVRRAEPYLQRIVREEPHDADSRLALARLFLSDGRLAEAEAEARAALAAAAHPATRAASGSAVEAASVHRALAEIHAARGKREAAIEAYRMAIEGNAPDVADLVALGQLLAESRRWTEAAAAFREAAELRPDVAEVRYNLAAALRGAGDETAAIAAYEGLLARFPNDVQGLVDLGLLHARRGALAAAAARLERAVMLEPRAARAHFNLGVVHGMRGDIARAERHYRRAADLDPAYAEEVRELFGE